jgi:D-alanyl-D-alanine carboxypeptidase (penicillin-binding protein 5/6)
LAAVALTSSVMLVVIPAASAHTASGPSGITAKGAFLLDTGSSKTLWSKSADTSRPMASTTKLMTAVTVLESANLDLKRKITVKQAYRDYVVKEGASTADLKTGDKLTVEQVLHAMLLPSGCDAAMALADNFGTGSTIKARTASFISKMNKKAVSLGLKKTHYDAFDGISHGGKNYTSPRDMAKLAQRALKSKTLRTIVKKQSTVQKATNGRTYTWYNTNKLLGSYNGAIGIKTGTGSDAGPCLVFAATRNGRTVAGVVLHASSKTSRYSDAAKMLDYAFHSSTAKTMNLRQLPQGAQQD